jgi:GT2 family glycosyltransferase
MNAVATPLLDRIATRPVPVLAPPITTVSVVICTYTTERLGDLVACLDSLRVQRQPADQVIVVVDHHDELLAHLRHHTASRFGVVVTPNHHQPGLSGARNTGLELATGEVVVFLDDDATARPEWLDELLRPFAALRVVGAGGRIEPAWPVCRPWWFAEHLDWTVGCTNPGMPTYVAAVRNVFGASAAFRRQALQAVGGFAADLGRSGADGAGCEETDVCIRLRSTLQGAEIVYTPSAVVDHRVTPSRCRVGYVWRRCRAEGRSKARLAARVGAEATSDERRYARQIVRAVGADLRSGLRRPANLGRAAVLATASAWTLGGYVAERARLSASFPWS